MGRVRLLRVIRLRTVQQHRLQLRILARTRVEERVPSRGDWLVTMLALIIVLLASWLVLDGMGLLAFGLFDLIRAIMDCLGSR